MDISSVLGTEPVETKETGATILKLHSAITKRTFQKKVMYVYVFHTTKNM